MAVEGEEVMIGMSGTRRDSNKQREPRSVLVLGPPLRQLVVALALALLVIVSIYTLVTISNQGPERAGFVRFFGLPAIFLACGVSVCFAGMRSRIEARDEELVVVNLFVEHSIARAAVVRVDGDNGVVIRLRGGEAFESLMYAPSVWQALVPSKHFARVAVLVQQWVDGGSSLDSPTYSSSSSDGAGVRSRASSALLIGAPAALLGSLVYGALLWALSPVLYGIVTA